MSQNRTSYEFKVKKIWLLHLQNNGIFESCSWGRKYQSIDFSDTKQLTEFTKKKPKYNTDDACQTN
jgi:hypothetical protein